MPFATNRLTNTTQAVITSSLRNRIVGQFVKDTELRLEVGPLSASWVLEYHPQGLLQNDTKPSGKSYKFGDVHSRTPSEARVEAGHADANPCKRIAKRQRPKPSRPWTRHYRAEEIQRLWVAAEQIPAAYGNYLRAMLHCPLRASEMANMRCDNVELDAAATLFQSCVKEKASTDLVFPLAETNKYVFEVFVQEHAQGQRHP